MDEFSGEYWEKMKNEPDFYARIRIRKMEVPSEIFNQKLSSGWQLYHGSDVARIRLMMKYGGIYLDNDVYVVSSLDKYRRFEIAMGWDQDQFIGSQVIIANKNARFLPLYLDTYKEYHPELWWEKRTTFFRISIPSFGLKKEITSTKQRAFQSMTA